MLRSVKNLIGYQIQARDGVIGHITDFHFDDREWKIRYLAVKTTAWFGNTVHISPAAFYAHPKWNRKISPVLLTKEEVRNSPEADSDKPVDRQMEMELTEYYQWPEYWKSIPERLTLQERSIVLLTGAHPGDPHLRSAKEVTSYHIHAEDGEIGHVDDFIADDEEWLIRYLVVDTRNFLPGKKVLLSARWIQRIEWGESMIYASLKKETIRKSPPYAPSFPVNRGYEEVLYDYYGKPKYWQPIDDVKPTGTSGRFQNEDLAAHKRRNPWPLSK